MARAQEPPGVKDVTRVGDRREEPQNSMAEEEKTLQGAVAAFLSFGFTTVEKHASLKLTLLFNLTETGSLKTLWN